MSNYFKNLVYALTVCLLAACEQTVMDMPTEPGTWTIAAGPMNNYGGTTRSSYTMWPEEENCIKTLAFFQFDPEGMHTRDELYNFRSFVTDDSPYGVLQASISDVSFKSYKANNTTICVVANVTEQDVNEFYNQYTTSTSTQVRLDEFKEWTHKFQYKEDSDSLGHLKQVCMFGYYEGTLDEKEPLQRLILGRLCSRIEITLQAENDNDFEPGVSFAFDNVPTEAHYFSTGVGVTETQKDNQFETTVPSVKIERQMFYFYMPGNSAQTTKGALKLNITFGTQTKTVTLCTLPPGQNEGYEDYTINRNSIYRFNLTLKKKSASTRGGESEGWASSEPAVAFSGAETDIYF